MKTLVLKCQGTADNPYVRGMNELRLGLVSTGDGSEAIRLIFNENTITTPVKYEVISGNAYFKVGGHTSSQPSVTEAETTDYVYCYCSSGKAVVSIKNFDIIGNKIKLTYGYTSQNIPRLVLLVDELSEKGFLTALPNGALAEGDMQNMCNLPFVENVNLGRSDTDSNLVFSFNDLKKLRNATSLKINRGLLTGGDVYDLLCQFNTVSIELDNVNGNTIAHNNPIITCSYISGVDSIPTMTFTKLTFYKTSNGANTFKTTEDLKAFLQFLADGISASKITLGTNPSVQVMASNDQWNDTDVAALRSTLTTAGVTLTKL